MSKPAKPVPLSLCVLLRLLEKKTQGPAAKKMLKDLLCYVQQARLNPAVFREISTNLPLQGRLIVLFDQLWKDLQYLDKKTKRRK